MVAVISVDAYPFVVFSGRTVLPDSKETEFGSSNQEVSPSAGKNTELVSVPSSQMDMRPYSYSRWCEFL